MIEIKTEKVIKHDEPMYKVLDIKALWASELPEEYLDVVPNCQLTEFNDVLCLLITTSSENYNKLCKWSEKHWHNYTTVSLINRVLTIFKGYKYHKNLFERTIEIVEQCGENLKKINGRKKLEENWHGEKVWEI
jgi:hypothetical protein